MPPRRKLITVSSCEEQPLIDESREIAQQAHRHGYSVSSIQGIPLDVYLATNHKDDSFETFEALHADTTKYLGLHFYQSITQGRLSPNDALIRFFSAFHPENYPKVIEILSTYDEFKRCKPYLNQFKQGLKETTLRGSDSNSLLAALSNHKINDFTHFACNLNRAFRTSNSSGVHKMINVIMDISQQDTSHKDRFNTLKERLASIAVARTTGLRNRWSNSHFFGRGRQRNEQELYDMVTSYQFQHARTLDELTRYLQPILMNKASEMERDPSRTSISTSISSPQ